MVGMFTLFPCASLMRYEPFLIEVLKCVSGGDDDRECIAMTFNVLYPSEDQRAGDVVGRMSMSFEY